MTNFDFLLKNPDFATFSDVAVSAEQLLNIDAAASVLTCRRAMEFAVKWMYSVDAELTMPEDERLQSLMDNRAYRNIVGEDMWHSMKFIRSLGNSAAHDEEAISTEQAALCLENLYYFMDFIAYCYSDNYSQTKFNKKLLELTTEEALAFVTDKTIDFEKLVAENLRLKELLTSRRTEHQKTYVTTHVDRSSHTGARYPDDMEYVE